VSYVSDYHNLERFGVVFKIKSPMVYATYSDSIKEAREVYKTFSLKQMELRNGWHSGEALKIIEKKNKKKPSNKTWQEFLEEE